VASILFISTYGSDDPTRASIPFISAQGAIDAGHEPAIVLIGEATYLMKDAIADQIQSVGWPPLRDILPKLIAHGVPIYV
jgi:uncharacterized protein involved in oxidation of intracellular sulfur